MISCGNRNQRDEVLTTELQQRLLKLGINKQHITYPQIFLNNKHIGGSEQGMPYAKKKVVP